LKIVYVTHESFIDHSYTIVSGLRKMLDMFVFIQAKEENDEIKKWCEKFGAVFVKRTRYRNPFSLFTELSFLLKIKKLKADNVWFNTLTLYQILIVKFLLKDFLVNIHDVDPHPDSKDYHAKFTQWLTYKLLKKRLCVVSKTQASLFKVLHGFEPKVFRLPIINYYTETGRCDGKPVIDNKVKFFFFGSIEPYKGIETLLDAAEILEKKNIEYCINIYGKLKYNREILSEKIKNLKNIKHENKFIDYRDIHSIYSKNNVLVLPYKQVTQCGPLLIGYSEIVPSVCNDLLGFREYVDDGKSGFFYNGTAKDLANKIEFIILNFAVISEMKNYISSAIKNKLSIDALADEYISNLKN